MNAAFAIGRLCDFEAGCKRMLSLKTSNLMVIKVAVCSSPQLQFSLWFYISSNFPFQLIIAELKSHDANHVYMHNTCQYHTVENWLVSTPWAGGILSDMFLKELYVSWLLQMYIWVLF